MPNTNNTPVSREDPRTKFWKAMTSLVLEYDFYEYDPNAKDFERDVMEAYDQSLKAFADEVERELPTYNSKLSRDYFQPSINPQRNHRNGYRLAIRETKSALKDLKEKWGVK